MTRVIDWLRLHPWAATSFAAGALLGLLICLPLVPYVLPDGYASLIGAAFGAIVAIFGAQWVADAKDKRTKAASREYVRRFFWTFQTELRQLIDKATHKAACSDDEWRDATERLGRYSAYHYKRMTDGFAQLEPLFASLGPIGIAAHIDSHAAVFGIINALDGSASAPYDPATGEARTCAIEDRTFDKVEMEFAKLASALKSLDSA